MGKLKQLSEKPRQSTVAFYYTGNGQGLTYREIKSIAKILSKDTTITHLIFEKCFNQHYNPNARQRFTESMIKLADALKHNQTLQHFTLVGAPFHLNASPSDIEEDKSASASFSRALAAALRENTTLQSLDIRETSLGGDDGVIAIAEALRLNSSVTYLRIAVTDYADAGIIAIAETLKTNTTLQKVLILPIDDSPNLITDNSLIAIAEALRTNDTLQELAINSNNATNVGFTCLANALRTNSNSALHTLTLKNGSEATNHISLRAFIEMLKECPNLTQLNLQQFNIYASDIRGNSMECHQLLATLHQLVRHNQQFSQLKQPIEKRRRLWNLGFMWGGEASLLHSKQVGLEVLQTVGNFL